MSDTPIAPESLAEHCIFPGNTPLGSATTGWDVVYAVAYSEINKAIAVAQTWKNYSDTGTPGEFEQLSNLYSVMQLNITGVELALGGSGHHVKLKVTFAAGAELSPPQGAPVTLPVFAAILDASLAFTPSPSQPGLQHLSVSTSGLKLCDVQITLDVISQMGLTAQLQAFFDRLPQVVNSVYAHVFDQNFAHQAGYPWLKPTYFDYAVADKVDQVPANDGVLAVLGSISGDVSGLSAQVNPALFPTNPGVTAAIAISPTALAQNALVELLSETVQPLIGDMYFDTTVNAVANKNEIKAIYVADELRRTSAIVSPDEAKNHTGTQKDYIIPKGALTFGMAGNSLTMKVTGARLDMGKGYWAIMNSHQEYQLIVDAEENIDMVLVGEPEITTAIDSPHEGSVLEVIRSYGLIGLGMLAGEAVPFLIDRSFNFLLNVSDTNERFHDMTLNYMAAERQVQHNPRELVSFDIGVKRSIVLGPVLKGGAAKIKPVPVSRDYLDAVTLTTEYPYSSVAAPEQGRGTLVNHIEDTLGDLPGNRLDDSRQGLVRPRINNLTGQQVETVRTGRPSTSTRLPEPAEFDLSWGLYGELLQEISLSTSLRKQLRAKLQNTGISDAVLNHLFDPSGEMAARNVTRPDHSFAVRSALFKGCMEFITAQTRSGKMSMSLYERLLRSPHFTKNPELAGRFIYDDSGSQVEGAKTETYGVGDDMAPWRERSIRVTTLPEGRLTEAKAGVWHDLYADANSAHGDGIKRRKGGIDRVIVENIIRNTKRPTYVSILGGLFYLVTLALGYGVGKGLDRLTDRDANKESEAEKLFSNDSTISVGQTLIPSIKFNFMDRYTSTSETGPKPTEVLRCAAINGGLVCGLSVHVQ